jgi:endoglucanase
VAKSKFFVLVLILLAVTFISFSINKNSKTFDKQEKNSSVVEVNGSLNINGNLILNKKNEIVVLKGMSLFWSQWMGKYYNYDCIKWLRDDWNCSVIRIAMGVRNEGYLAHPKTEMERVTKVIDACIHQGIYVIVDWHSHTAYKETKDALKFFREIAQTYGNQPNIIYEIYNEPDRGLTWNDVIKPYADSVIKAIRKIDPDNIIIVGTPTFSQDVEVAAANPIIEKNIAYAVHFYSATHKQWLRDKVDIALKKGICVFISEFGTCESSGNGKINYEETKSWFDFMNKNHLSWCNWSVADKDESASVLKKGASESGNWTSDEITESGNLVRNELRKK